MGEGLTYWWGLDLRSRAYRWAREGPISRMLGHPGCGLGGVSAFKDLKERPTLRSCRKETGLNEAFKKFPSFLRKDLGSQPWGGPRVAVKLTCLVLGDCSRGSKSRPQNRGHHHPAPPRPLSADWSGR